MKIIKRYPFDGQNKITITYSLEEPDGDDLAIIKALMKSETKEKPK